MADLLQYATHDQIAIAFCCAALVISGAIMHFSVHVGRLTGKTRIQDSSRFAELQLQRARSSPHASGIEVRDRAA